jgi:hypothetical protein
MKNRLLLPLALAFGILLSAPASALDIPLLTWEQGKSQSVVLGGPMASENWQVSLVAASGVSKPFRASSANEGGFRVYTIDVNTSQAEGRYTVETQGPGSPRNVVSEVLIVPAERYEVPRAPYDLFFILLFLALFITLAVSIRRVRTKVTSFPNRISDIEGLVSGEDLSTVKRFKANSLEASRVRFVAALPESFLKTLLIADSNFAFSLPFRGFISLPGASILLGGCLFLTHESSEPFSQVSILLLIFLLSTSIFDFISGLVGAFTFLALNVALSGSLDIRNGLSAVVLVGVFLFPALFNLAGNLTSSTLNPTTRASYALFTLLGVFYIPCAYLVIKSLRFDVALSAEGLPYLLVSALVLVAIKNRLLKQFLASGADSLETRTPETEIPRLFSNGTILGFFIALTVLFINWTEEFTISIAAALAWSVPLLLSSVRFEGAFLRKLSPIPRLIWLEVGIVVVLIFGLFQLVRTLPYLVEDSSALLLLILAIPTAIHSLFVLLVSSSRDQEVKV